MLISNYRESLLDKKEGFVKLFTSHCGHVLVIHLLLSIEPTVKEV